MPVLFALPERPRIEYMNVPHWFLHPKYPIVCEVMPTSTDAVIVSSFASNNLSSTLNQIAKNCLSQGKQYQEKKSYFEMGSVVRLARSWTRFRSSCCPSQTSLKQLWKISKFWPGCSDDVAKISTGRVEAVIVLGRVRSCNDTPKPPFFCRSPQGWHCRSRENKNWRPKANSSVLPLQPCSI